MKETFERVLSRKTLANLIVVLTGILFYILLSNFGEVRSFIAKLYRYVAPFATGIIIAYLLNPVARFFETKVFGKLNKPRAARSLGVLCTVLLSLAVVVLLVATVVPQLVTSVKLLISNLESYFDSAKTMLNDLNKHFPILNINVDDLVGSWNEIFAAALDWISGNFTKIIDASYKFGSGLVEFLLGVIISIYVMLDAANFKRNIKRALCAIFSAQRVDRLKKVVKMSDRIFMTYVGMNLLDSLIIGVANFAFMLILGMPYALLITVIVVVTNFIPTFGPFIGGIPSALLILLVDPPKALWFIIWTIVLQQIDGNLLKPLLFGSSTGLSPMWVLGSIVIGGRMFGVAGMLLAVPAFSILSEILDENINARLARKALDNEGRPLPPKEEQQQEE